MIGSAVEFTIPYSGTYRGLCFDVRHGIARVVVLGHPQIYEGELSTFTIVNPTYTAPAHRPKENGIPTPMMDDPAYETPTYIHSRIPCAAHSSDR